DCDVADSPPPSPVSTRTTPLTCSKTASIPQKQPPASTAVCSPLAVASGASTAGLGTGPRGPSAEALVVLQAVIAGMIDDKIRRLKHLSKFGMFFHRCWNI